MFKLENYQIQIVKHLTVAVIIISLDYIFAIKVEIHFKHLINVFKRFIQVLSLLDVSFTLIHKD